MMELFILVFIFVIAPILICANLADNKARSVIPWVLVSLFFGWLAVLVLACLSDKTVNKSEADREELKKDLEIQILQQQLNNLKNS